MPVFNVTDPDTGVTLRLTGDSPPTEQELMQIFASAGQQTNSPEFTPAPAQQQPASQDFVPSPVKLGQTTPQSDLNSGLDDPGLRSQINDFILSAPGGSELAEFGAAVSRGATDLADFFISKPVNAALNLAGTPARLPLATEELSAATQGNFLEDGTTKNVIRAAGEFIPGAVAGGGALRAAAQAIPAAATTTAQTLGQGITRQLGATTAAQDVGFAAVSGAGGAVGKEIGGDTGELVGALLSPIGAVGAIEAGKKGIKVLANSNIANKASNAITDLLGKGRVGVEKIVQPADGISKDGAGIILAEQMVREGKTPEQLVKEIEALGPEGIPADLNEGFARVLRVAADRFSIISGGSKNLFNARNSKAGNRLLNAFDDASGTSSLTLSDEIKRLDDTLGPRIKKLYSDTRKGNITFSNRLNSFLDSNTPIGQARQRAEKTLEGRRLLGEEVNNIDVIDATKQQLDDDIGKAIRTGANNEARDLIRLKNAMVQEADAAIPVYKEARDLFAGKQSLEAAGNIGQDFFKIKASDLPNLVKSMGESERNMFLLGAKKAMLDKVDSIGVNRNAFNALFGKNGDAKKLRFLFKDGQQKEFNKFIETLEREGNFRMTDAVVRGNSTTNRQLQESFSQGLTFRKALLDSATLLNPFSFANKISSIIGRLQINKEEEAYKVALQEVANILMTKGMNPDKLFGILTRKDNKEIEKALRKFAGRKNAQGFEAAEISQAINDDN